ncbi:hypothetical protein Taro_010332, partial [Colocasia esculenta]|nr:hypothetical protein [Colocasia esculenta]
IAPSSSPQGSSVASTSSVAGPSAPSAPSWGRGTSRRGPTRGVTERRLPDGQQWNVSLVRGYGVGPTADHFTSRMGVLTYQWERTEKIDWEMLAHMSAMHRSWRSKQKKKVADRNKQNRATQSMPYRRGRTSHYQLMNDFSNTHGRTPHRLEVFKMGRCKDLPDGSESWVDEESMRRYEAMTQMIAPSEVDAESHTTATPEDAFISVMGKDRPGRVRCAGSGETLSTWAYSSNMVCLYGKYSNYVFCPFLLCAAFHEHEGTFKNRLLLPHREK